MRMRIRNNLSVLLLLMALFYLSGCSHDSEPDNVADQWAGHLSLILDIGVVEPGSFPTRALNEDSYFEQATLTE